VIDIQSQVDGRGLVLPDVGVAGLRHLVSTGDRCDQSRVIATLALGVSVGAQQKGTHMSRLVQLVMEHENDFTLDRLPVVAKRLLASLETDSGRLSLRFPLVVEQPAPVTGLSAQNVHDAELQVRVHEDRVELQVGVEVIATSLCPCSRAISDYGAHNQRSRVSVSVSMVGESAATRLPLLRELVTWAEESCSCPTYPLLKRPDERAVTMSAYDHAAFVEDIARDLALRIQVLSGPGSYQVHVVNEESIHRHDAYATVGGALHLPDAAQDAEAR
jgi:GTP cyclohydrolase IB